MEHQFDPTTEPGARSYPISIEHVTKRYGPVTAVDDVSFRVEKGEILGFLGPNGAGKTTTMRVITGYLPASEGTVRVAGFDVFEDSTEVRRRIGYLPENPPLYDDMGVVPYLRFAAKLRGVRSDRVTERRFRQDERFEEVELAHQTMEFLYADGDFCVFMHPETYEQINLPREILGPYLPYLEPNQSLNVELLDGQPLQVDYPETVELHVESTPEPLHMDDGSVPKDATLSNGMQVQVPQFVKKGDKVLFSKYAGTEIKVEGEELLIMREDDIVGVIEG